MIQVRVFGKSQFFQRISNLLPIGGIVLNLLPEGPIKVASKFKTVSSFIFDHFLSYEAEVYGCVDWLGFDEIDVLFHEFSLGVPFAILICSIQKLYQVR